MPLRAVVQVSPGFTGSAREAAWRVYRAQEARWRNTQVLTAVTEDHVDRAPWFVYNSVHTNGRDWVAVTDKGEDAPAVRSLSTKAAFGWHALYGNDYTRKLLAAVPKLAFDHASLRRYDRPLAITIITRIMKIHTSSCTCTVASETATRMNEISATPVTP